MLPDVSWEQVVWDWRDPQGVVHGIRKRTSVMFHLSPAVTVCYVTWCGQTLSVDDVPRRTRRQRGFGTSCVRCAVKAEPSDGSPDA